MKTMFNLGDYIFTIWTDEDGRTVVHAIDEDLEDAQRCESCQVDSNPFIALRLVLEEIE